MLSGDDNSLLDAKTRLTRLREAAALYRSTTQPATFQGRCYAAELDAVLRDELTIRLNEKAAETGGTTC